MTIDRVKQFIFGATFSFILLAGVMMTSSTTALAQRYRDHHWHHDNHSWGHTYHYNRYTYTRPRVYVAPRIYPYTTRVYTYPGTTYYGNTYYVPSANYTTSYYGDMQNGYNDGFDRGREDARDGRGYNPNNSSHFRNSYSSSYRDGFARGYAEGYRQFRW